MSNTYLRHSVILCSIISIFLLLSLFQTPQRTQTDLITDAQKKKVSDERSHPRKIPAFKNTQPQTSSQITRFQDSQFYRTLIDNNLFRPLGWKPPRPREPYRLIGTIIPTDPKLPPQAIIQVIARKITPTVTLGDKLDKDTTVTGIQPKQVTLETQGQPRNLKLSSDFWIK